MSSLQDRVHKLEAMLPQEPDYGEIYDFIFEAEQTIGCPPGISPDEKALRNLGDRSDFINDRRAD